ncbi:DNA adenine methylase [Nocardia sp. NPDC051929]|uniref:DNA adenine methylase n=1 Tax=Nocardia sp. NPDC051929 TaxID=3364327 RepID=UPI0037C82D63
MDTLRSPVMFYGSKARIAARIVAMFPPHAHYVEPCAGSLSVLLAKPPARMETVNDLDGDLMTFWRVLRDRPADLERVCALTPYARGEHRAARLAEDVDELERARRVWVRLTQGRSGSLRVTGWRHARTAEGGFRGPARLDTYLDRIAPAAHRLRQVSLECRPAVELLRDYGTGPRAHRTLIYLDPPYPGTTRARNYRVEATTAAAHTDLADQARACTATVVVSGYACDLYDQQLYPDWYRYELQAFTTQGHGEHERTEVLWSNRPLRQPLPLDHPDEFRYNYSPEQGECNETRCAEPSCRKTIAQPATGRRRRYCSSACRTRACRARATS